MLFGSSTLQFKNCVLKGFDTIKFYKHIPTTFRYSLRAHKSESNAIISILMSVRRQRPVRDKPDARAVHERRSRIAGLREPPAAGRGRPLRDLRKLHVYGCSSGRGTLAAVGAICRLPRRGMWQAAAWVTGGSMGDSRQHGRQAVAGGRGQGQAAGGKRQAAAAVAAAAGACRLPPPSPPPRYHSRGS